MLKKLKSCFQKRGLKNETKHVKFLHANALLHDAAIVAKFLEDKEVAALPCTPYFPCDYFLFPRMKMMLACKKNIHVVLLWHQLFSRV